MKTVPQTASVELQEVPRLPAWAGQKRPEPSELETGFAAGAALILLNNLVQADHPWAGAWRHRLALRCAAAAMRLIGRREDEQALRDGYHLRQNGEEPGPAVAILEAWFKLARRTPGVDERTLGPIAADLGLAWDDRLSDVVDGAEINSKRLAPILAARLASEIYRTRPDAELLAFAAADLLLAHKLRWPTPLPLLLSQVNGEAFKDAQTRRRIRPGEPGFVLAAVAAYAVAAQDALELAGQIAPMADRLAQAAPRLRAKGASEVIKLLLTQDAVPASWSSPRLSARGARRLFDRLTELGAVRELSGRPTFRLYGL